VDLLYQEHKWKLLVVKLKVKFVIEEEIFLWDIISNILYILNYFRNDKATSEAIDERGFLHSGDVGMIDKKGNLTITGRIKELIITAGGENIAPVLLENEVICIKYLRLKNFYRNLLQIVY